MRYCDLSEFGLPLVTPDTPGFAPLVEEIESRLHPMPALLAPAGIPERGAVLLNQTGRAIVALDFLWRYTLRDGKTVASRFSSLGSSVQREVLTGRSKAGRDVGTFILPGSKRLITEQGVFGNNLDVLHPDEVPRARGWCGGLGGDGGFRGRAGEELTAMEFVLDLVILEDGLCVGPNESGLFEALNEALEVQTKAAQQAAAALRGGASEGRIFEILRPLARRRPEAERSATHGAVNFVSAFGAEAIHRLINENTADLLAWFENAAQPRSLQLRRP